MRSKANNRYKSPAIHHRHAWFISFPSHGIQRYCLETGSTLMVLCWQRTRLSGGRSRWSNRKIRAHGISANEQTGLGSADEQKGMGETAEGCMTPFCLYDGRPRLLPTNGSTWSSSAAGEMPGAFCQTAAWVGSGSMPRKTSRNNSQKEKVVGKRHVSASLSLIEIASPEIEPQGQRGVHSATDSDGSSLHQRYT